MYNIYIYKCLSTVFFNNFVLYYRLKQGHAFKIARLILNVKCIYNKHFGNTQGMLFNTICMH